jgi:methylenetetrahydrofolate dehydrogenase (NADP+)/methenyltetrahydrofolate cyclohydrolase
MMIDGKKIAADIKHELKNEIEQLGTAPVLAIVIVGDDPVIESFVRIKKKFAGEIGVHIEEHRYSDTIDTDTLLSKVEELVLDDSIHGVVVQLPLSEHIQTPDVLHALSAQKDVDVISQEGMMLFESGDAPFLPPVVGAIEEILRREAVSIEGKKAVVLGNGRLVGKPAALWLKRRGAHVSVLDRESIDTLSQIKSADVLVLGAGVPGFVKPDMIQEGVVILDAGTSEEAGKLAGDADPSCGEKASIFTPVPGGIGPITVAILFRNVIRVFVQKQE